MFRSSILFLLLIALFGARYYYVSHTLWQLPVQWVQKPLAIEGVVDSIPEKKAFGTQFLFQTQILNHQALHAKLLLSWYQHPPKLIPGQRWVFTAKLKPPIGVHNPGGFDYGEFLTSQGISATGSVNAHMPYYFLGGTKTHLIDRFRQQLSEDIHSSIAAPLLQTFISALSVGLRDGFTEDNWQVFQNTGTNHLVAIAGLHIGFVAGAFYKIVDFLWRRSQRLLLWMPAIYAAQIAALIGAFSYTLLSGFAIPAQRASLMLLCFFIGHFFDRPLSLWRRWCFAFMLILCLFPRDIIDSSFWLSFGSIAIIAWTMQGRLGAETHLTSLAKMQTAIILGLIPLMLLFFQQLSVIAFFTNAIAIPWVGFILLPLALLGCFADLLSLKKSAIFLFYAAGKAAAPLWLFLEKASHVVFSTFHYAIFSLMVLFFSIIGFVFLLTPRYFPGKWIGCFGLLPLFFYQPPALSNNQFKLTVIDVGQGLSVLIQTKNHVMLYDTGAHLPGGIDYGESVVTPALRLANIHTIDRVEISHGDNDHSGGANAVLKNFHVLSLFSSAPAVVDRFHGQYCTAGQSWLWDGVRFDTLSPTQNDDYQDNNSSCVIKISNGAQSALLTGDIERETEEDLVMRIPEILHSTVLIAPHHGSKTSSSEDFLMAVSPRYVVISSGKYNRYHLPSPSILARYQAFGLPVFNTADQGQIRILIDKHVTISTSV